MQPDIPDQAAQAALLKRIIETLCKSDPGLALFSLADQPEHRIAVRFATRLEARVLQMEGADGLYVADPERAREGKEIVLSPMCRQDELVGVLAHELAHHEQQVKGHLHSFEEMRRRDPTLTAWEYALIASRNEANAAAVACEVVYEIANHPDRRQQDRGPLQAMKEGPYRAMAEQYEYERHTRGARPDRETLEAIRDEVANAWHRSPVAALYREDFLAQHAADPAPKAPPERPAVRPADGTPFPGERTQSRDGPPPPRIVLDRGLGEQTGQEARGPYGECLRAVAAGRAQIVVSGEEHASLRGSPDPVLRACAGHAVVGAGEGPQEAALRRGEGEKTERDEKNERLLNAALAAGARYLITEDRHLLRLMDPRTESGRRFQERCPDLAIVRAEEFVRALRLQEQQDRHERRHRQGF